MFAFPLNFQQDSVYTFVKPEEKSSKKATAKGTKDGHKIQSLNPMNYTIQQVDAQNLVISAKFKPGQSYRIELDTALVKDLRGRTNDTASWQFVVRKADEYARLRLELKSNLVHPLLFLMDEIVLGIGIRSAYSN